MRTGLGLYQAFWSRVIAGALPFALPLSTHLQIRAGGTGSEFPGVRFPDLAGSPVVVPLSQPSFFPM